MNVSKSSRGRCPLCLNDNRELREGHIIPAFAGRYLKETSATGFLRDGQNPNLRRQDIAKQTLLCDACEQRFSNWEREFSQNAFPIVQKDDFRELRYDSWLLKFAVSLSWRVLVIKHEEVAAELPQFKTNIQCALEDWRLFLLDERKNPCSVHHMFVFAGVPESMSGKFHEKTLHYMLRGIDATTIATTRQLGVYSKMIRSIFYSPIVPASPTGWANTRIHAGPGRLGSRQVLSMPGFMDFIQDRIEEVHSVPLSEKQQQKVNQAILAHPERALASESFAVHRATRRLIGSNANKPTRDTDS